MIKLKYKCLALICGMRQLESGKPQKTPTLGRFMQMKRIRWAACLGALLINTALNAAEIRGRVYDANNAIYISGARVIIEETGEQLSSERNGRFVVSGLEPGTYTLSATAVGYS